MRVMQGRANEIIGYSPISFIQNLKSAFRFLGAQSDLIPPTIEVLIWIIESRSQKAPSVIVHFLSVFCSSFAYSLLWECIYPSGKIESENLHRVKLRVEFGPFQIERGDAQEFLM